MANLPEILAPAGSREAFFAALNSGADAVYLAGERFGARAYAANFPLQDLPGLIRYAHLRRKSVYVAVNTLLNDEELPEALDFCRAAYLAGADALIVQDMGLAAELTKLYPQIPLNASTQMTLHNSAGVQLAGQLGFRRVILSREVSLADIQSICRAGGPQIEVFAHGALCICYSGQCLFSSMVGGRSGNRGRCAQPCRLRYRLLNGSGDACADGHLLSPKDLNAIELLPQLKEAGVASLKLEGRMKRPEYVAQVSSAYAAAKHGKAYDKQALQQAFNRGFTTAYLVDEPGADMMSYERPNNRGTRLGRISQITPDTLTVKLEAPLAVGDGLEIWVSRGGRQGFTVPPQAEITDGQAKIPLEGLGIEPKNCAAGDRVFKTLDTRLLLPPQMISPQDDLPLTFRFGAKLGGRPVLTAEYNGKRAEVQADYQIPAAQNRPADLALLRKQLGRLGGSGWHLAELSADFDDGIMLPASVLNNLRRDAVAALEEEILLPWRRTADTPPAAVPHLRRGRIEQGQAMLTVVADSVAAGKAALTAGADCLYLQAYRGRWAAEVSPEELAALADLGKPVYALLPTIATEDELPLWRRRIEHYRRAGFAGVAAGNLWAWHLWQQQGAWGELIADFGLNCFNAAAAEHFAALGAGRVCLSKELNAGQLAKIAAALNGRIPTEVQVFGNLELMNSRHCPIGAAAGGKTAQKPCSGACRGGGFKLVDEKGFTFPVYTDEFCRSHIYNGFQLCLIDEAASLSRKHSALRLDLAHYSAAQTADIVKIFRAALSGRVSPEAAQSLAQICGAGLTKGHYFRGVE